MKPNDEHNRIGADAQWAQFVDHPPSRAKVPDPESLTTSPKGSSSFENLTNCDLTESHLDDLELDGILRELGRYDQDDLDFAENVMDVISSHFSDSGRSARKIIPLPIPSPVFDVSEDRRESESHERVLENESAALEPFLFSRINQFSLKAMVIGTCLTIAFVVGFLVTGDWPRLEESADQKVKSGSQDSEVHNLTASKFGGDSFEPSEADDVDLADLVEAVPERIDDGELLEAQPEFQWIEPARLAWGQKTKEPVPLVIDPLPEAKWKFAIRFDKFGIGTIRVNRNKLSEVVFRENADMLLHNIGNEAKRRFQFLESHLGRPIGGEIVINGKPFPFQEPEELAGAVKLASDFIRVMDAEPIDIRWLMERRKKHVSKRELTKDQQRLARAASLVGGGAGSVGTFPTTDEVLTIREAVGFTEEFLRDHASELRRWEKKYPDVAVKSMDSGKKKSTNSILDKKLKLIGQKDFDRFIDRGELRLPAAEDHLLAKATLQKLNSEELKEQLFQNTRSFNIFRDIDEFRQASSVVQQQARGQIHHAVQQLENEIRRVDMEILGEMRSRDSSKDRLIELRDERDQVANRLQRLGNKGFEPLADLLPDREDLQGLPLVMGDECHLDRNSAEALSQVSVLLGSTLAQFDRFGSRDEAQNDSWRYMTLKQRIAQCCQLKERGQALSTLDQMLQIDHPRLRVELINALRASDTDVGIELLTRRAKFDLRPEVRLAATTALSDFSGEQYRDELLKGFRYPWTAVAQHSAEALVRLDDKGAIPELLKLLNEPNPQMPHRQEDGEFVLKEVVAINHMKNCFLCHAPSTHFNDKGRALVPDWERPLAEEYYQARVGTFVKADTTYLRQDFSVIQPVEDHGPWPENQRFDYVVFNKKMSKGKARDYFEDHQDRPDRHREAVIFALEKLTGERPVDDSHASWVAAANRYLAALKRKRKKEAKANH